MNKRWLCIPVISICFVTCLLNAMEDKANAEDKTDFDITQFFNNEALDLTPINFPSDDFKLPNNDKPLLKSSEPLTVQKTNASHETQKVSTSTNPQKTLSEAKKAQEGTYGKVQISRKHRRDTKTPYKKPDANKDSTKKDAKNNLQSIVEAIDAVAQTPYKEQGHTPFKPVLNAIAKHGPLQENEWKEIIRYTRAKAPVRRLKSFIDHLLTARSIQLSLNNELPVCPVAKNLYYLAKTYQGKNIEILEDSLQAINTAWNPDLYPLETHGQLPCTQTVCYDLERHEEVFFKKPSIILHALRHFLTNRADVKELVRSLTEKILEVYQYEEKDFARKNCTW